MQNLTDADEGHDREIMLASASETKRLAAEVQDLQHIHELSLRLTDADTLTEVLLDVLQTASRLVNAPLGSIQIVNSDGALDMIGEVGFGTSIIDQFPTVSLDDCTTCAVALKRRARVAVKDLRSDHDFTEIAVALYAYGAKGAVSTPVLDKSGNVLAMFSVYWRESHEVDERELRILDLCAELAGRHVERSNAANAVRDHDRRQTLLMRELAHRGKNLLSVIQSIAGRTLVGDRTLDEASEIFSGRIRALASTYDTLTDESADNVDLYDIVTASLKYYGDRTMITGPSIEVPARNAQTIALVIHELATNAAKYGALSTPSGHVECTWLITDIASHEERFSLEWNEIGGPLVSEPKHSGFGSIIITTVVGRELRCEPAVTFEESGVRYRLECSLSNLRNAY